MKFLKLSLCAAVASIGLGGAALAQSAPTFAVNVGITSDYVFRGFSQTHEYDPGVQGGVDATMGLGYAGVWASNVGFGNGTDAEVDLYGGVRPPSPDSTSIWARSTISIRASRPNRARSTPTKTTLKSRARRRARSVR